MGGFPTRPNRSAYGPDYEDERPVENVKREIGAGIFNLSFWQIAGIGRVVPKAVLICSVDDGVITTLNQLLAFDPNGELSLLAWTYNSAGSYSLAFADKYPDELENDINTGLIGGLAQSMDGTPLLASVDMDSDHDANVHFASVAAPADPTLFIVVFW
jgi:hypothetical protein